MKFLYLTYYKRKSQIRTYPTSPRVKVQWLVTKVTPVRYSGNIPFFLYYETFTFVWSIFYRNILTALTMSTSAAVTGQNDFTDVCDRLLVLNRKLWIKWFVNISRNLSLIQFCYG